MTAVRLPIANPCHEDWDAMDPRARGRFCQSCAKDVHDLAEMTETEAKSVLAAHAGQRICVRYNLDVDGSVRFRSEVLPLVALAGLALAACAPHDRAPDPVHRNGAMIEHLAGRTEVEERPVMGEAPMIEPPPPVQKMGKIAAPSPPVQQLKGDIAVPNEPCDPPPPARPAGALDDLPRFDERMR